MISDDWIYGIYTQWKLNGHKQRKSHAICYLIGPESIILSETSEEID